MQFSGIDPAIIQTLASMEMNPDILIALAFQELAEKPDKIGQPNISPDLDEGVIGKVKIGWKKAEREQDRSKVEENPVDESPIQRSNNASAAKLY